MTIQPTPLKPENPLVKLLKSIPEALARRDYGQLIIFAAVGVGIPRWAGAMLAADGIRLYEGSTGLFQSIYWFLVFLYGMSSFGMALLEVMAVGYVFDGLRNLKPFYPSSGKVNIRWWGSVLFGIVLLVMMPVILGPNMLAQLHNQSIIDFLGDENQQAGWIVTVIMAPAVIIAGVAFARDGMIGTSRPSGSGGTSVQTAQAQPAASSSPAEPREEPTPSDEASSEDPKVLARRARAKLRREKRAMAKKRGQEASSFPGGGQ